MTSAERQAVMDIAELQINRYFDHYLTEVFPGQLDRMFKSHGQDTEAHELQFDTHFKTCPTKKRVDRVAWMVAGVSVIFSVLVTLASVAYYVHGVGVKP